MSFFSDNISKAFKKNQHLKQFVLTDVVPTNIEIGRGAYGSVEEVSSLITYLLAHLAPSCEKKVGCGSSC